jgi:cytidine deaminase
MVLLADGAALCTPCGGCRQRIREFAEPATEIHLCGLDGVRRTVTIAELLPLSFGPDNLRGQR